MSTVWKADQKAQNTVEKAVKYKENRFLCVKELFPTQQDSASFIVHVCFFGAQATAYRRRNQKQMMRVSVKTWKRPKDKLLGWQSWNI